ncbi:WXG100 family type VII secretion target [Streptomyces sp. NPDC092296]|uniref:WXG100 family type VII secretion target n=1 Tax=Streptomyces sp. NPDC092296 TaxID=3366012 RepID=UPI0038307D80
MAQDPGVNPYGAKSDFEAQSHARLKAMVETSDPSFVMNVGTRLTNAHQVMEELGNDLMNRMAGLEWTGAAADSFKEWGRQVSKATLELSEYSRVAGDFMTNAGETLSNVKAAMPEVPEDDIAKVARHKAQPSPTVGGSIVGGLLGGAPGALVGGAVADRAMKAVDSDWVTADEAKAAQTRVDSAHQQAIAQMEKLGQSYEMSTDIMSSATVPKFPPTPESLMPPRPLDYGQSVDVPVGGTSSTRPSGRSTGGGGKVTGTTGGTGGSGTTKSGTTVVTGTVKSPVKSPTTGGSTVHVSTGIDSVTTAPPPPSTSTLPPGAGTGTGGTGGGHIVAPPAGGFPTEGGLTGGTRPGGGTGLGGRGGGKPGLVDGEPGPGGGRTGLGGKSSRPGYTGGAFGEKEPGVAGGSTGRRGGYGGTTVGAEEGGQAGAGSRTGSGTGRGGAATGRGATSSGGAFGEPGEGHGGAGAHGSAGGAAGRGAGRGAGSGRRLATEEGGLVGGRRGPGAGGEFTPGGSGLRARGGGAGAGSGADPHGMAGGSAGERKSRERRGRRPDYLLEDEETWGSAAGDSNPAVIE